MLAGNKGVSAIQSPIMVVGAGRSGSTLVSRIFQAHSEIDFKGETSFLLLRLWVELWHDRFWLNWPRHVATSPRFAADPLPPLSATELAKERARVGGLVAALLGDLLRVDLGDHRIWGYKELWSGLPQYNHDWGAYDCVFPGAYWMHLIRHPFDFARSCAAWNGTSFTYSYLENRLSNWLDMLCCHRARESTGRYHEARIEDVVRAPAETLMPVLEAAGLSWQPRMSDVLATKTMGSKGAASGQAMTLPREDAEILIESVPGLAEGMRSCGYEAPEETLLALQETDEASIDLRDPEREGTGAFLPRHALEAQLDKARNSLAELSDLLADDTPDALMPFVSRRTKLQARALEVLTDLKEQLRQ